jgi:hypothetical protein
MLKTSTFTDVSTAQITAADNDRLLVDAKTTSNTPLLLVTQTDAGFWMNTNIVEDKGEMEVAASKYSETLMKLILTTHSMGCPYLHLDADAKTCDDLPTFDW